MTNRIRTCAEGFGFMVGRRVVLDLPFQESQWPSHVPMLNDQLLDSLRRSTGLPSLAPK